MQKTIILGGMPAGWIAGWLVSWLVGSLIACLAGWLANWPGCAKLGLSSAGRCLIAFLVAYCLCIFPLLKMRMFEPLCFFAVAQAHLARPSVRPGAPTKGIKRKTNCA